MMLLALNNWALVVRVCQNKYKLCIEMRTWTVKLYPGFKIKLLGLKYTRLSLSRLRLSRITAYLEVKVGSLFKHENLTTGNKI